MFFLLFPLLLFVMFVTFECYIKERKKIEKWRRGVNCEEIERKKMRWVRGDVCV